MPAAMTFNHSRVAAYLRGEADEELFARAHAVRRKVFGDAVFIRAIIEFSNVCNKQCRYCGLRASNPKAVRYRLDDGDILAAAALAVDQGAGTIVLQSGDDFHYDAKRVGALVSAMKNRHNVAVTLSLGDREEREFEYWRECGADRYLIKAETSDPALYESLRCGERHERRLERIRLLKKLGYEVGSGVITGLPGTDERTAANDILMLTELELDMIAVGPFQPHPDTPLASAAPGSALLSHRTSALLRLLNPGANIPATSALDAAEPGGRLLGLGRGCNVLMPSVTPQTHKGDYFIYPGKNTATTEPEDAVATAADAIRTAHLSPSSSKGFARRNVHVR